MNASTSDAADPVPGRGVGSAVQLLLFGRPQLMVEGVALEFAADKRHQLLAFLAFRGDWVHREELAFRFWPDRPEPAARHALRQLLKRTRRLPWLQGLEVEPQRLRWPVATDVAAFLAALASDDLPAALAIYRHPLLEGMDTAVAAELNDWLEVERQRLRTLWREASLAHAESLRVTAPAKAAVVLRELLDSEPFDEHALRALLRTLSAAGRHEEALAAYRQFGERLLVELDMQPATATDHLAETIAREALATPTGATADGAHANLPSPATSFIGRTDELAQLGRLLADPACRLVTITGLGGAGKSRLAVEAAAAAAQAYPGGVYHVALDHVGSADQVSGALAAAMGIDAVTAADPYRLLVERLRQGRTLLVLDNFEHLTGAAGMLSALLDDCAAVDMLLTSRVPLDLANEWLLPLHGLDLPTADAGLEEALAADAVRLLIERARRVAPRLTLDAALLPYALRICRTLGGSPLAIELATVWARKLPLAQVAAELERNLDLLVATNVDAEERHGSVRAIFEQSWRLLSGAERKALTRLSPFSGGFTVAAAELVAGAGVAVLGSLVDKALVRIAASGRYDLHPLVHQFARDKAKREVDVYEDPVGTAAANPAAAGAASTLTPAAAHARYFLTVAERAVSQDGRRAHEALAALAPDLANLHAALAHFERSDQPRRQLRLAVALAQHYLFCGPYEAGAAVLERAMARGLEPRQVGMRALLLAGQIAERRGRNEQAVQQLGEARRLAAVAARHEEHALALSALARVQLQRDRDPDVAADIAREAVRVAQRHGTSRGEAEALFTLATIERESGQMTASIASLVRAHELFLALKDDVGIANSMKNLGNRYLDRGEAGMARASYEQALRAYEALGDRRGRAMIFDCLGLVATKEGNYAEAVRLHGLSAASYREHGDLRLLAPALAFLAQAELAAGNTEAASRLLEESISLQLELGNRRHLSDALRSFGDVAIVKGDGRAASHYRRSLALAVEVGDSWGEVQAAVALAGCLLDAGEIDAAEQAWSEALPRAFDMRLSGAIADALEGLVQVALIRGNGAYDGRLAKAARLARDDAGEDQSAVGRRRRERYRRASRQGRSTVRKSGSGGTRGSRAVERAGRLSADVARVIESFVTGHD